MIGSTVFCCVHSLYAIIFPVRRKFHLLNRKASSIAVFSAKVWLVKIIENGIFLIKLDIIHHRETTNLSRGEKKKERNFYVTFRNMSTLTLQHSCCLREIALSF